MKNSDLIFKGGLHQVTSKFGLRLHPTKKVWLPHNGVDYGTFRKNIPCYAIADGVVRINEYNKDEGNKVSLGVEINGQKYRTVYKHLQKLSHLKVGDKVKKGDLVGYVGTSGDSTGIHLHFDFIKDDNGKLTYLNFEEVDLMTTETVHIVKQGEVLWQIAAKYGYTWQEIAKYNDMSDKQAGELKSGQLIKIPNKPIVSNKPVQEYIDTINLQTKHLEVLNGQIEAHKRIEAEQTKLIDGAKVIILNKTNEIDYWQEELAKVQARLDNAELELKEFPREIFISKVTKEYRMTIKKGDTLYIKED